MKTKHTPWRVEYGNFIVNSEENIIASLDFPSRTEANANLIAASPDMLDSLTEFVDYYEDMKPVLNDELQAMLNRAEKAIRKAT